MAAKSIAKTRPALSAVATEENDADVRYKMAATHLAEVQQDLALAMAIMDVAQAIVGTDAADRLYSDKSIGELLAHGRARLEGTGVDVEELFNCFRLERAAAEVANG